MMRVSEGQQATNATSAFNTTGRDHLVRVEQEASLPDIKDWFHSTKIHQSR
jgi:hypothetical protein